MKVGFLNIMKWCKEKVIEELKKFIINNNFFPNSHQLKSIGKNSLNSYIYKFGGANYFRKLLKQPIIKRDKGELLKLNDFDNLKFFLLEHFPDIQRTNIFPTALQIKEKKLSSISQIICNHGGASHVANKLGCLPIGTYKTLDGHYVSSANEYEFDNWLFSRNIKHEYNQRIDPKSNKKYRYDFKIRINRKIYYIEIWGMNNKKYNETRQLKENFYKKTNKRLISIEKLVFTKNKKELEMYFDELFVNLKLKLTKNKYLIKDTPRLYNENLVEIRLKEFINQIGKFPNSTYLLSIKEHALIQAICRYGGFNYWRRKLNVNVERMDHCGWNENSIAIKIKFIIDKYGKLPCFRDLTIAGENDIAIAIVRNGGFVFWRKKLKLNLLQKPSKWCHQNDVIEKLHEIKIIIGHFPSFKEITEYADSTWNTAISKLGGIKKFKLLHDMKYELSIKKENN